MEDDAHGLASHGMESLVGLVLKALFAYCDEVSSIPASPVLWHWWK